MVRKTLILRLYNYLDYGLYSLCDNKKKKSGYTIYLATGVFVGLLRF